MQTILFFVIGLIVFFLWFNIRDDNSDKRQSFQNQTDQLINKIDTLVAMPPQLVVTSWGCHSEYGYMITEGQIENISGKTLENVTAVASYYTASGEFVTSDTALVEYNPLLPGQRTPFKTITRGNPAIKNCNIDFKHFWGGAIKFEDAKTRKAREREEANAREKEETAKKNPTLVQAQKHLTILGYDIGSPDGVMGSKTRAALQQFAEKEGLQFDGGISNELLELLRVREKEHLGKR